ncbi:MAG: hypothetical protein NE330_07735 [Lentisphaeraceae bacterium]|nr:hypothetical protein [Lentisphaeraceae bacterium]
MSACSEKDSTLQDTVLSSFLYQLEVTDKVVACYQAKPYFYEVPSKETKTLLRSLTIVDYKQGFSCMCDAELVFYFYREGELLFVLGIHPDRSIRKFKSTWSGDAVLSYTSKKSLSDWLLENLTDLQPLESGSFSPPDLE